jgi:hypothetical protein
MIRVGDESDRIRIDMINILQVDYMPGCICWIHRQGHAQALLAWWVS